MFCGWSGCLNWDSWDFRGILGNWCWLWEGDGVVRRRNDVDGLVEFQRHQMFVDVLAVCEHGSWRGSVSLKAEGRIE